MADLHDLAGRLQKAVADRTAIEQLGVPDLPTAYAVQRILRDQAGPLSGWKLGVTSRAKQKQVGAIMTATGSPFFAERKRIVELAGKYRLPSLSMKAASD